MLWRAWVGGGLLWIYQATSAVVVRGEGSVFTIYLPCVPRFLVYKRGIFVEQGTAQKRIFVVVSLLNVIMLCFHGDSVSFDCAMFTK